jgi:hypothetical protein
MFPAPSDGQGATGEETRNDGVPGVFSLTHGLDGTVKRGEQPTPDTKVTPDNGRTGLDGGEGTVASFTVGRVTETLDSVPHAPTNDSHRESTAEVVQDYYWTWISGMVCGHYV